MIVDKADDFLVHDTFKLKFKKLKYQMLDHSFIAKIKRIKMSGRVKMRRQNMYVIKISHKMMINGFIPENTRWCYF
jgi:hypothetical protein